MQFQEVKQFVEGLNKENLLLFKKIVERQIEIIDLKEHLKNLENITEIEKTY